MKQLSSPLVHSVKMENHQAQEEKPLTRKIHIVVTTLIIMTGMGVLDGYLVEQNYGSRRTGVFVMLLIGDVCLLLVLRYVALWVGTEVRTMKRGCSMIEWFLFVFVLDIKMYFILESVRKDCSSLGFIVNSAPLKAAPLGDAMPIAGELDDNLEVRVDVVGPSIQPENIAYRDCEYSLPAKKMLTLFQAVLIGGLYLLLVGADHLQNITCFRELEEVKMRAFWVVIDLLDILELQSSMWEAEQGQLPYLVEGFVYFYCYIVLIILPPLSLAEMCKEEEEVRPHKMLIYLIGSLCVVNIGSSVIRLELLLNHNFAATSTIFIGKNVICLGMKVTKLIQMKLIHMNRLSFAPPSLSTEQEHADGFVVNGNAIMCRSNNTRDEEDRKSLYARHENDNQYHYGTCKDEETGTVDGGAFECVDGCEHKRRVAMSECSTLGHVVAVDVESNDEPPGGLKSQASYEEERMRRVKFNGQQMRCVSSTTSGSDAGSSLGHPVGCSRQKHRIDNDPRAPRSLENIFSEARSSPRPPTIFSNGSSSTLGRNRHSCALNYTESHCVTPVSQVSCSCPQASRSTGDMSSLTVATSAMSDFPAPVDVCFSGKPIGSGDIQTRKRQMCARNLIAEDNFSDSELSDLAPPPPSMTLLQQSVLGNGCVKQNVLPRTNFSDSDAESTSV